MLPSSLSTDQEIINALSEERKKSQSSTGDVIKGFEYHVSVIDAALEYFKQGRAIEEAKNISSDESKAFVKAGDNLRKQLEDYQAPRDRFIRPDTISVSTKVLTRNQALYEHHKNIISPHTPVSAQSLFNKKPEEIKEESLKFFPAALRPEAKKEIEGALRKLEEIKNDITKEMRKKKIPMTADNLMKYLTPKEIAQYHLINSVLGLRDTGITLGKVDGVKASQKDYAKDYVTLGMSDTNKYTKEVIKYVEETFAAQLAVAKKNKPAI